MATPPAPMPPQVAEQASPEAARSAFMAQGVGQPQSGMQMIQQIVGKTREVAQGIDDLKQMLQALHPPTVATLNPIEIALRQMLQQVNQIAQRSGMAQGSPVMQSPPQGAGNPGANPPNPMGM